VRSSVAQTASVTGSSKHSGLDLIGCALPVLFHSYIYDGVQGYQTGSCITPTVVPGPPVCSGMWSEPGNAIGVFMSVVKDADSSRYETWWSGLTSNIDYASQFNNTLVHMVEVQTLSGVVSDAQCSQNASLVSAIIPHSPSVWDGAWSDSLESGGYGGEFRVCTQHVAGTTVLTGVYSEIGYVRGLVSGQSVVGEWWEVGTPRATLNRGNFTLTLGANGTSFTGTWSYGATGVVAGAWNETRLSMTRPSKQQCFASQAGATASPLVGHLRSGSTDLYICAGDGGQHGSSAGPATSGAYQQAACFTPTVAPGPPVCAGVREDAGLGVFMTVVQQPGTSAYESWWATSTATINYTAMVNNSLAHGVRVNALVGVSNPPLCARNASLATKLTPATNAAWDGVWTDSLASEGYGGEFHICTTNTVDGVTVLTGVYSQVGYVRGVVHGQTVLGEWWEPGSRGATPNHGNFTLRLGLNGSSFSGTWTHGAAGKVAGAWNEQRLSATRPSNLQCFAESSQVPPSAPVFGSFVVPAKAGTRYYTCETPQDVVEGSYVYPFTNGTYVEGYEQATCTAPTVAPGPRVCTGLWYEPNDFFGVYMNVIASRTTQYSTWWAGVTSTLNYTAMVNNTDLHGVDLEEAAGPASAAECGAHHVRLSAMVNKPALAPIVRVEGRFNFTTPLGFSGTTHFCLNPATGEVSGLTAGVTSWTGYLSGTTISGWWLDAGATGFQNLTLAPVPGYSAGWLSSHGTFNMSYSASATGSAVWTGTKWYDSMPGVSTGIKFVSTALGATTPQQCFGSQPAVPMRFCMHGGVCVPSPSTGGCFWCTRVCVCVYVCVVPVAAAVCARTTVHLWGCNRVHDARVCVCVFVCVCVSCLRVQNVNVSLLLSTVSARGSWDSSSTANAAGLDVCLAGGSTAALPNQFALSASSVGSAFPPQAPVFLAGVCPRSNELCAASWYSNTTFGVALLRRTDASAIMLSAAEVNRVDPMTTVQQLTRTWSVSRVVRTGPPPPSKTCAQYVVCLVGTRTEGVLRLVVLFSCRGVTFLSFLVSCRFQVLQRALRT